MWYVICEEIFSNGEVPWVRVLHLVLKGAYQDLKKIVNRDLWNFELNTKLGCLTDTVDFFLIDYLWTRFLVIGVDMRMTSFMSLEVFQDFGPEVCRCLVCVQCHYYNEKGQYVETLKFHFSNSFLLCIGVTKVSVWVIESCIFWYPEGFSNLGVFIWLTFTVKWCQF